MFIAVIDLHIAVGRYIISEVNDRAGGDVNYAMRLYSDMEHSSMCDALDAYLNGEDDVAADYAARAAHALSVWTSLAETFAF